MMFMKQFVARYPVEQSKIFCVALHPGVGITELMARKNNSGEVECNPAQGCCGQTLKIICCLSCLMDNLGQLAFTQIWCGLIDIKQLKNGAYYAGRHEQVIDALALNERITNKLWNVSIRSIKDIVGHQKYMDFTDENV